MRLEKKNFVVVFIPVEAGLVPLTKKVEAWSTPEAIEQAGGELRNELPDRSAREQEYTVIAVEANHIVDAESIYYWSECLHLPKE